MTLKASQRIATIIAGIAMSGAAGAQPPMGWIELRPVPGRSAVEIVGHALAFENAAGLEFRMSVRRENRGNRTDSRQARRIDLAAGETKVLSAASINVEPGDSLTLELRLLDRGQEVFSTIMSAPIPGTSDVVGEARAPPNAAKLAPMMKVTK